LGPALQTVPEEHFTRTTFARSIALPQLAVEIVGRHFWYAVASIFPSHVATGHCVSQNERCCTSHWLAESYVFPAPIWSQCANCWHAVPAASSRADACVDAPLDEVLLLQPATISAPSTPAATVIRESFRAVDDSEWVKSIVSSEVQ
jgi:hypothetical protein